MPALDACHAQIVRALQKDGWRVDDHQQWFYAEGRTIFIDVFASRYVNGDTRQLLLAEIKCFPDRESTSREIYIAVGQYLVYRKILQMSDVTIPLYLAVPREVYDEIFDAVIHEIVHDNQMKLVIVDLVTETIVEWIE